MKNSLKHFLAISSLALVGAAAVAGPITSDALAKIEPGMSMEQVQSIAGKGREVNLLGDDGATYKYSQVADPLAANTADVYITYGDNGLVKSVQSIEHTHD